MWALTPCSHLGQPSRRILMGWAMLGVYGEKSRNVKSRDRSSPCRGERHWAGKEDLLCFVASAIQPERARVIAIW